MPKISTRLIRLVGLFFLADGLLGLAFGRAYVCRWQLGPPTSRYRRMIEWLAARPGWLLRLGGAAEAGLGLGLLRQVPVTVPEIYRSAAGFYDTASFLWRDWLFRDAHQAFDRALATYLPPGGQVLDLGCGTAANLQRLLALELPFSSYTGVDFSAEMLARARTKFADVAHARFRQLDLETDPLPDGPFDLVVSTYVFEHLRDPESVVAKAWERLRPGGHIVLLFEVHAPSWADPLVGSVCSIFSARLLPVDQYRRFPGVVSADRFSGTIVTVALVVLHRPTA